MNALFPTLVDALRDRARTDPGRLACVFLQDGEEESARLTFGELDERARAIAVALRRGSVPGDRALLLYPPGLEFVAAFLGCLYAGVVPVPSYPPAPARSGTAGRGQARLRSIAEDCAPGRVLAPAALRARIEAVAHDIPALERAPLLVTDEVPLPLAEEWEPSPVAPGDLAFLQYTSGSTSEPKGVLITHGNLVHNEEVIRRACDHDERSTFVSWLPIYHDMGLIGSLLQPLYVGSSCVLMAPVAFLQKPVRWLRAISRWRAHTSGAPDFAYDLCVRKIPAEQREGLDLSSWRIAFNGSEPVRARTLEAFTEAFGPSGFRSEAFFPCYGLAEATLIVSGAPGTPPVASGEDARPLVGCGPIGTGLEVAIVDPASGEESGETGEIWVSGPSVARGYWNRPEITEQTFGARLAGRPGKTFLRTGDLGFLREGQLFVSGRLKDLIIVRGRNHYPQDLELTAADSHPALRGGAGAAFSVDGEEGEGVVLVLEIDIRRRSDPAEVLEAARRAVVEEHEVPLLAFVLVRPGAVPKTTSGKVRRRLCRDLFLAGELEPVAQWRSGATQTMAPETPTDVAGWLRSRLAAKLGVPMDRVDPGLPLAAQGLDSLAAVELAHEIETAFGVELPIAAVLESPDLSALANSLAAAPAVRGERVESSDRLSAGERALWFLQQADPEDPASHVVGAARLLGDVDENALRRAFQALVDRHPALRTTFSSQDGEPVRRVHASAELDLLIEDVQSGGDLRRRLDEEVFRPFDLERGPLLRVFLFRRSAGERVLLLTVHHAVADFWSLAILARELGESYAAGGAALAPALGAQDVQGSIDPEAERYWLDRLTGYPSALDLPIDRPRPVRRRHRAADVSFALDGRLRALGRGRGATLFPALLAAFQALLHRVTGQDRLLVGSPTAGRDRAADAGRVGYLVNPVVLASSVEDDPAFETFLDAARGTVLGALEHAVPFPLLVERLHPERDPSRSPVFQVAFALQRAPHGEEALSGFALGEEGARLETGGLVLESMALARRPGQFDLTLLAAERDGEIRASLFYDLDLFDRTTIARWAGSLCRLAEAVAADPGLRLSEAPLWSEAERWQLLSEWNDTHSPPDSPVESPWVHELVALQAQRQPDAVAVRQGDRELTYGQLADRATLLARRLRVLGAGPEAPVAVLADRSPEQIAGLLAALQAGAPYLPLDPAYPPERIAWMVSDSGAAVLLTEEHRLAELPAVGAAVVILGGDPGEASPPDPLSHLPTPLTPGEGEPPPTTLAERPPSPGGGWGGDGRGGQGVRSDDLAYVIYTSGSTGRPKGVAISHASLLGLVDWHLRAFGVTDRDVASHLAGLGFDASVWEVWPYLAAGASLRLPRLPDDEVRASPERLRDWMVDEGVTVAFVPTVLAEPMMGLEWPVEGSPRLLLTGGDRLGSSPRPGLPFALWNNYGPTECTVVATSGLVEGESGRAPSLGRPVDGVRVHLLDRRLRPVPSGSPGEICLAGSRLARGYLRRPDLTAERFVPDPFSSKGGRIYRTGDLGRWTPDGRLEFLGRIDSQVQLRGVRVEPGEIEAALLAHPDVDAAVVVPVNGQEVTLRLDAFVAPRTGANPTAAGLREHLRSRLPAALVPAVIHLLPALPLTPNGKIDRVALAKEVSLAAAGAVPPRTPVEETLAGIWAELLGTSSFGVHDDFFALGGHSLLASQVVSRVRAALGAELPLRALFETPTVAELAESLEGAVRAGELPLIPVPRDGDLPLSFAQQRLWFLHILDPEGATYNVPGALHLDGSLDVPALGRALREIARRHEALRTTFDASASGAPVQRIAPEPSVRVPLVDLGALGAMRDAEAERLAMEEGRRPFDLRRGPLLRSLLLRLDDTEHRLVVNMHHIVADGWSLGVLLRELGTFYPAFAAGKPSPLPDLRLQVADFAVWQREWLDGGVLRDQMEWWKSRLAGLDPLLHLPTDRPRMGGSTRGAALRFGLPEEQMDRLEALGYGARASLFMTLLAGWKALLFRYTGQTDIAVGSPVANRGRVEFEDLIGCFVNTLVLRTRLEPGDGFRGLLGRMRETALDAFEHQDLPFERLVEELHPERELAHTPLFQVMFVLQNAPLPALHLSGLGLELVPIDAGAPKFDLTLAFERRGTRLSGTLEYRSELFDASTIARLVRHFERLLASAAADPDLALGDLPMLADEERAQLLAEWNPPADRRLEVRGSALLHERFEAWAERTPGAVAVACEGRSLTYRELDRTANQLARRLRALGVAPGARVGLWLERSVEMAVGMLGVLKAGAAYLPLDPSYPLERLAYMAKDGGISALVTTSGLLQAGEALAGALLEAAPEIARVLLDGGEILAESGDSLPPLALPGSALAYVLYTSGSTGRPKGVACHHFGVVDLVDDFSARSPLPPGAVCSLWASFSFDASVYEVWAAWLAGGRLEIATERVRTDGLAFAEWLAEMRVESAFVSPPMLVDLAEVLERREIPLRRLLVGVEPVPEPLLAGIVERVPGLRALNGYGPTETTICCTLQAVEPPARERNTPVGMPVRGGRVYLLGPSGELVPAGVPGEVYIAGSGVTWGYLGRPDLTAERFLPDPYGPAQGAAPGGRMYRTGDLARHLADGALFFLGRIDRQIKLRGVRMEPDEIEEALRELPGVREVAVGARRNPDGDLRLVAWVVTDGTGEVGEIGSLREALRARLPEVMVPSAFVPLDALPLTVNGKVDRAALPDPDWRRAAAGSGFVAPRTMVEEMLAEVWTGLLGLDRIGIHDSFFDVGGHSLKAGQLVLRVRDAFGVELPVRTIFEAPTIATQAVAIGIMLVEQADPETLAQTLAEI